MKGCYAYTEGTYAGQAYFGAGGSTAEMSAPIPPGGQGMHGGEVSRSPPPGGYLRCLGGQLPPSPSALLQSRSLMSTLREIREEFLFPTHHPLSAIFRIRSLGGVACWI